jgi:membrane-associated protease RseP (regulator of RpoE activity)
MNSGKTIGYLLLILLVSMACVMCVLCGVLAGGAIVFTTAGAKIMTGGPGLWLPNQQWPQVQPRPFVPNPQVVPQGPQSRVTPPAPLPQRTPQAQQTPLPQRTPQALRPQLPAGQSGALVEAVDPGSAAEKAGIQVNDLIIAVNGAPVDANHALADLIRAYKPGDKVTLSVQRKASTRSMDVTLGSRKLDTGQEVASLGVTYSAWPAVGPTN